MRERLDRFTRWSVCALVMALIGVLASARPAHANLIFIESNVVQSTDGFGTFFGSIDYTFDVAQTVGRLVISLTNTSSHADGGFITGFIFNINSVDPDAAAVLTMGSHPFLNAPHQSAPPFGDDFTAGAALGGSFLGGGNPNDGIAFGQTGTFNFDVTASDAAALTAESFISGPNTHNFIVRFRGFSDGESDKVPGVVSDIPEPSALLIMLLGAAVPGWRRRRIA